MEPGCYCPYRGMCLFIGCLCPALPVAGITPNLTPEDSAPAIHQVPQFPHTKLKKPIPYFIVNHKA